MFRYGFLLMTLMVAFLGVCDSEGESSSADSNVTVVTDTMGVEEEDAGDPSLEEPSDGESQLFDAGAPLLTEASLQEEDATDQEIA